jgi:Ca-activated chloride channel family protein
MDWQHPEWLYLILPLGAMWLGLSLYSRRQRRRAANAFVAQAMWSRILPGDSPSRFWMKTTLRETALVAGLISLAGPRWGTQYEEVVPRGSDLYILIDVSRSMLAQDVPPSRLARAKSDVAALINRLEGERVGLIAFAGQAVVKCPLTVDYDAFRRTLDELDTGSAPRGGTAIGDAIRKALEVFHARAERDQAILLITDGDDQQSYPLEAAAVAAERHVTIFTVGLGDADQGARVPLTTDAKSSAESKSGGGSGSFVEYQGQQVWSKLDNALLKEIALKTSGVYVPVGTKAYDLGELYADYLQGRRGAEDESRKRLRRGEQFQIFLALALLALLADLFIHPYARSAKLQEQELGLPNLTDRATPRAGHAATRVATALLLVAFLGGISRADDPDQAVREGLQFYREDAFDKARDKFAAARDEFDKADAAKAAIAAFDEACASHRNGDVDHAREWYLKAGLAHDRGLAARAHFNLGTLAAEEARRLAGDNPETVPAEKRQAILDQLKAAVASFRHSLELQSNNSQARRDIELVRQWIKYYTGKWYEHDRQKRRDETNLVAFLEFLIETQRALRESSKTLTSLAPTDAFAELKRVQDELLEEIPPLKEKIRADLQPREPAGGKTSADSQELEQGIKLLQSWADAAGDKMSSAAHQLASRNSGSAAADQQSAIDELEKIWDAVIPFQALLARDLADQTQIARTLQPPAAANAESTDSTARADSPGEVGEPADEAANERDETEPAAAPVAHDARQALSTEEDLAPLTETQERTSRRTQLLRLKAEAELERLEKSPPAAKGQEIDDSGTPGADPHNAADAQPTPVDPEKLKAGYEKAIELAPRAVEQMDAAVKALKQNDRAAAYPPAEEARKILEEIQQAQPRQEQPEQNQNQQQKNDNQQKNEQENKDQQDEQKQDGDKKDQPEKDQEQKKQDEQDKSGEKKQPQVSKDQIEEALRKVRERQQEKRERDRKMKARLSGRTPVEKDW